MASAVGSHSVTEVTAEALMEVQESPGSRIAQYVSLPFLCTCISTLLDVYIVLFLFFPLPPFSGSARKLRVPGYLRAAMDRGKAPRGKAPRVRLAKRSSRARTRIKVGLRLASTGIQQKIFPKGRMGAMASARLSRLQ